MCFLVFLVLFLSYHSTGYAQVKYIGGSAGFNLSKLDFKDDLKAYDFNFRNGFKCGIMAEYELSNSFLTRIEINYAMKGTEYGLEEKYAFPKHKFIEKLNYMEIPVLFQYYMPSGFIIKPQIFIGPEIAFLLNSKIEYIENDKSIGEYDDTDKWKSAEYGLVVGIGADYELSVGKILFDIRYNYGLSNINKSQGSRVTSNTLLFNIGYAFRL